MIVKLSRSADDYSDLTPEQHYVVIGIEADEFRLLNDHGRPYLYPHNLFEVVDPGEPSDWIVEIGEDGERYAYPPEFNSSGFFEDFFDRKETDSGYIVLARGQPAVVHRGESRIILAAGKRKPLTFMHRSTPSKHAPRQNSDPEFPRKYGSRTPCRLSRGE